MLGPDAEEAFHDHRQRLGSTNDPLVDPLVDLTSALARAMVVGRRANIRRAVMRE
jgi:hypothetical protein